MSQDRTLSRTRRLVLLCAKSFMETEHEEEAVALLHQGVSVADLIETGTRHKVLQLITPNLLRLDSEKLLELQFKRLLLTLYSANRERNKALFSEGNCLIRTFNRAGLTVLPLKGLHLAQDIYRETGARTLNDLDLLIRRDDRQAVSDVMRSIGYVVGDDDPISGEIKEASRREVVKWSMYIGNLHKHVKRLSTPFAECCRVDFSYDPSAKGNYDAAGRLFELAVDGRCGDIECKMLNKLDFFLHINLHLYKEAVNERWLEAGTRQNLIKYCDLREYLCEMGSYFTASELAERAVVVGAEAALRFSMPRLLVLFPDRTVTSFVDGLDAWAKDKGVALFSSTSVIDDDPEIREWLDCKP